MTSKISVYRNKNGTINFPDFPEFKPNLKPNEIFKFGSFGGTYWRPIKSSITNKNYKDKHLKFPKKWWKDIDNSFITLPYEKYDKNINKYKVFCGSELEDWENAGWIKKYDPYGWVQWYCNFYNGRRLKSKEGKEYDKFQIGRWMRFAGERGRFRNSLITYIKRKNTTFDDYQVSPKIRQSLQHWGYILTKEDFESR